MDWVKLIDLNIEAMPKVEQKEIHISKMVYDYVCKQLKIEELKEYKGCKIVVH